MQLAQAHPRDKIKTRWWDGVLVGVMVWGAMQPSISTFRQPCSCKDVW